MIVEKPEQYHNGSGFSHSLTLQELEIIFEFSEHRIEKSEDWVYNKYRLTISD